MSGKMTKEDSSRIQSTQEKGGHDTGSGTFASRAQSAGDKHESSAQKSTGDNASGGTSGGGNSGKGGEGKK